MNSFNRYTFLLNTVLIMIIFFPACQNNSKPVVKPSKDKPEKQQIQPHDFKKTLEKMPLTEKQILQGETNENNDNAISPITYQGMFTLILGEGVRKESGPEKMSEPALWNEVIQERSNTPQPFMINEEITVDKVIMLDEWIWEAHKINEKYHDQIKQLEPGHWIFFLTPRPDDDNKLDFAGCFAGLKISNPERHGIDKARTFHGLMYRDNDLFILRAAMNLDPKGRYLDKVLEKKEKK